MSERALLLPLTKDGVATKIGRLGFVEHFLQTGDALRGVTRSTSGTGATANIVASPAGRIGICQLATGTTSGGRASIETDLASVALGGGVHHIRWDAAVPTAADVTDSFSVRLGMLMDLAAWSHQPSDLL